MAKGKAKHPHDSTRPESPAVKRALASEDPEALRKALTYRQRRFCEEYIVDFNGTAAVVRAGYSPKYPEKQAYQLMMNDGVLAYIDYLSRSKEAKLISINPEYVVQKVVEIATKEAARDGDKLRALELLARHLGMFVDRTEITGKDGEAIRIEQQKVKEEADSFLNTIRRIADKKDATLI